MHKAVPGVLAPTVLNVAGHWKAACLNGARSQGLGHYHRNVCNFFLLRVPTTAPAVEKNLKLMQDQGR